VTELLRVVNVKQSFGTSFNYFVGLILQGTKVCQYNWHSAGSLGWPFPMLKYKYIFQIKYTEAILSDRTRKLLWFEISKMLIAA